MGRSWRFAHPYGVDDSANQSWISWEGPFEEANDFLFALLAGVRNFEHQFQPLFPVRGVPKDISEIGQRIVNQNRGHGHTHSWMSAAELLNHPWHDRVPLSGFVTPGDAAAWRDQGIAPSDWARDSSWIHSVPLAWTDTKVELCGGFVTAFLPTLPAYGPLDDTRVLFFFDN